MAKVFFIVCIFLAACAQQPRKVKVHEMILQESPVDRFLVNFWKDFSANFNARDTAEVRKVSLDSIWLWGDHIGSNEFIRRYYKGYSSADFVGILDTNKIRYSSIGCHPSPKLEEAVKLKYSDACNCQTITISKDTVGSVVEGMEFTFLETTTGYRLFGINHSSYYWRYDSMVDTTIAN
jgi:hypothetical protein